MVLEGRVARLEPLTMAHAGGLIAAANDGELWHSKVTVVPSAETLVAYIGKALDEQAKGRQIPFVIVHRPSDRIAGTTRYMNVEDAHRRREIGSTWIAATHQRTALNSDAKLLLLTHAFEDLRCIRVEFVTDELNTQSRAAILRLGAKEEGVFRNHMVMPDGRYRHSVCHSIIEAEWPAVKARLLGRLESYEIQPEQ
jgi:N-acetyltransferase